MKASLGGQNSPLWPAPHVTLTQREISGNCRCTWVVTEYSKGGASRSSLKYRDAMCPAFRFHRALAAPTRETENLNDRNR